MTPTGKTMTCSLMNWALDHGFAWIEDLDPDYDGPGVSEIFWTAAGPWDWDATRQLYILY
jgi:hypothetical protein